MMMVVVVLLVLLSLLSLSSPSILVSSLVPNSIKDIYNSKLKNITAATILHDITIKGKNTFGLVNLNFGAINIFDDSTTTPSSLSTTTTTTINTNTTTTTPSSLSTTTTTTINTNTTTKTTRNQQHDSLSKISSNELKQAYAKCFSTLNMTKKQVILSGWKLVHQNAQENFLLYKKKIKEKGYTVIYLMIGQFDDISARSFLATQFDPSLRSRWDLTCKEMITEGSDKIDNLLKGEKESADLLYYRTRWPFPLRDRDYVLARRVRHYPDKKAIVLISKSTDSKSYPKKVDHVIRVDKYWCESTVFATKDNIDTKGMRFVTFFCDDQQIPLPNKLVDLLCKAGERVVPESMTTLHKVAQSTNKL